VGGSAIVNPHGRLMSGPSIGDETILYADCHAYHIKLAKALFDCLGHYTRWDLIRLQIRKEPRSPEIEMGKKAGIKLPIKELRQIAEKYEISMENLEELIKELNVFNSEQ
jgi:hypothetical protein